MLLRVISKHAAPTVAWTAQLCLSSTKPSLCSSLPHFPAYTKTLLAFWRISLLSSTLFWFVFFSSVCLFPLNHLLLHSPGKYLEQALLLPAFLSALSDGLRVALPRPAPFADLLKSLITSKSPCDLTIAIFVSILLDLWCLSSEVSRKLQPGSSWPLNSASSSLVSGCQCIVLVDI